MSYWRRQKNICLTSHGWDNYLCSFNRSAVDQNLAEEYYNLWRKDFVLKDPDVI